MTFKANLIPQADGSNTTTGYELGSSTTAWRITRLTAPTTAGGSTYGPGSANQALMSNGSTIYWGTISTSDNQVAQSNTTASNDYRILLSYGATDETQTATSNKNTNLRFNPGTQLLSVGGSISATGDLTLTGDANLNGETYADSLTVGSIIVNGAATFTQIPNAPTPDTASNDTSVATTAFVKNNLGGLSGAMHFKGTTTTEMSDGRTTSAVTINSASYSPEAGDVVLYSDSEYVWTGSLWERLGRDASFKTQQTPITDASYTGSDTATVFVSAVTQDANGNITVTKRKLPTYNNYSHPTATSAAAAAVKVGRDEYGHVVLGTTITYSDVGAASASHGTHVTYSTANPSALGTASPGSSATVARSDHVHPKPSLSDLGAASATHAHGNITNTGDITSTVAIASGDRLVINDESASKIDNSSITFGSSSNYALANNGTWQPFNNYSHPTGAGNNHIPSGGSSGQFLGWSSAGVATWVANPNTDTKQNIVLASTSKAYVTGVTTAPTSTTAAMTGVGDTGVYLTTTAGELSAVRHSYNVDGTEKAYTLFNTATNAIDFVFV